MSAEVGDKAPELTVVNNERKAVTVGDLQGKAAVLVFFPGAFTKLPIFSNPRHSKTFSHGFPI